MGKGGEAETETKPAQQTGARNAGYLKAAEFIGRRQANAATHDCSVTSGWRGESRDAG
jgi:hypothetical protein